MSEWVGGCVSGWEGGSVSGWVGECEKVSEWVGGWVRERASDRMNELKKRTNRCSPDPVLLIQTS